MDDPMRAAERASGDRAPCETSMIIGKAPHARKPDGVLRTFPLRRS